ncbi:porin family protein [Marivirga arenosa]|uniref:Outer membrane protein with beta-barrel domain n=1 Tax=Marivirga arenosa TaxID=3059076 RepID=A0AA49GDS5_9BACT|nr:hypothetical protein [Marivirga sp. BKB1-2]WKK80736.2 hypothetical protein QYS47_27200 [Marivirga sp. BKB1-2]
MILRGLTFLLIVTLTSFSAKAQFDLTLESGAAFNGYNDVRYANAEGNKGDLFSLTDDFEVNQPVIYARIEANFRFLDRNIIELTAAPLAFDYTKTSTENIVFGAHTYGLSNDEVSGCYEFNTYRASYRYQFIDSDQWYLSAGATVLIRDARIALSESNLEDETTDLGVVPLLSFNLKHYTSDNFHLLLKGDALVGTVGRAEDILIGGEYQFGDSNLSARAGYRIIEGGADIAQVYNFSLIHFASVGLQYSFLR